MAVRHLDGWKADRPDHRDVPFTYTAPKKMPDKIDWRPLCSVIEDQGHLGSCTAHASTSAMEFMYRKIGKNPPQMSRLFTYYATRVWVAGRKPSEDSGAMIREVMKALAKYGACYEQTWPYVISKYNLEPPIPAKKEAEGHQIIKYMKILTVEGIRVSLFSGYPVVIGFATPDNFGSKECAKSGIVQYPGPKEKLTGGHAILLVGYDDNKQQFIFQNSWGTNWGEKGFGFLPYKFITSGLAQDFWSIRAQEY